MTREPLWPALPGGATITAHPVGDPAAPAVVVLPGGGYTRLADHEGEPVARWLNSLGVAAYVARYRVAPHRFPLPLLDAARAVRWVRHHTAAAKVGVLGFSAGGHLAGLLATESGPMLAEGPHDEVDAAAARPDLAVLCYPVVRFDDSPDTHRGSVQSLLGGAAAAGELSVDRRVNAHTPPMFLWHTADDASVPVSNSLHLAAALAGHGVPVELHVYPHGRHGLGLAREEPRVAGWTAGCAAFLAERFG